MKKNKKKDSGQGTSVEEMRVDTVEAPLFVLKDYEEVPLDDFMDDDEGLVGAIEPL